MQNSYSDNRVSRGPVLLLCAIDCACQANHPGTNVYTIIFNPLVPLFSYSRLFLLYSHHMLFLSPPPTLPPHILFLSIVILLLIRYQPPFTLLLVFLFLFFTNILVFFCCINPHQPLVSPSDYFTREHGLGHHYFTTVGIPISFFALSFFLVTFC